MARKSTNNTMNGILNYEENREAAQRKFPHMPVGEAVDMGFDAVSYTHLTLPTICSV